MAQTQNRGSNLRRTRRVKLDVYLNKVIDEELYMCRAADISTEGIYLSRLIEPQYDGRQVALEFCLPGFREVIWATGEVVRDGMRGRAEGSGIRFTALPDRYQRMIATYVAKGGRPKRRRPRRRRRQSAPGQTRAEAATA